MTNNETTNLIERTIESSFEFLNNFSIRQLKKKNRLFLFSKIIFPSWFPKKINKVTKIWEISDNVAKRFRLARIYYSLDIVGLKKKNIKTHDGCIVAVINYAISLSIFDKFIVLL